MIQIAKLPVIELDPVPEKQSSKSALPLNAILLCIIMGIVGLNVAPLLFGSAFYAAAINDSAAVAAVIAMMFSIGCMAGGLLFPGSYRIFKGKTLACFLLMNAVPGSPFLTEKSTQEMIARANAKYGLDKPLYVQLFNYIKNYLKGDLGTSLKMQEGTSVSKIIFHQGKFELSLKLGVYALLLAVIIGIPLGCIAA